MLDSTLSRVDDASGQSRDRVRRWLWPALLVVWFVILCVVPDPRPLGARPWAVDAIRKSAGIDGPAGRLIATLVVRAAQLVLLGVLIVLAFGTKRWDRHAFAALILAPFLAIVALWINLGYFPIVMQVQLAGFCASSGTIAAIALQRRPITAVVLVVGLCSVFAWLTATRIRDNLDAAARAVGRQLLASSGEIPDGDEGQARLIELAFRYGAADSPGSDPVLANEAAILALSVILGEEKIATVARRDIDPDRIAEARALRERVSLQARKDWSQHFWVSAGLTLLSDDDRSIAVGLSKELMDAMPGGSGFSFADLGADAAGNAFTIAATRDAKSARAMQARIRAGVRIDDFVPKLGDLPEGLSRDELQDRFGGLGGEGTRKVVEEIRRRVAACAGLR
jgi:hypothetical protein